jgi:histidine triad (HIT) family protein
MAANESECLFCKFTKKQIEPAIVYENEYIMAFLDINPAGTLPGHTIIIPKKHFENIYTTPNEYLHEMFTAAKNIAAAVKKTSGADGINIIQNNEKPAGQAIMHVHIHIIPRKHGDGIIINENRRQAKPMELTETAKTIKETLQKK